jgi:uncharacterized protein (DUF1499 family)
MRVADTCPRIVRHAGIAGLVVGLGGIAGVALSAAGYRLGWWQVSGALTISEYAVYAAGVGFLLSATGILASLTRGRRRGLWAATLGLAVSVPVLAMAIGWEYTARTTPPINDISTDTQDTPVFWDMPTPTNYPAQTAATQRAAYPDLAPLKLPVARERAFALALGIVRDRGWDIVAEDKGEGRIEAVATSFLYGFKDEIAIRITPTDAGALIDLRSRSRLGRIDRGVNAKRISVFLRDLEKRAANDRR